MRTDLTGTTTRTGALEAQLTALGAQTHASLSELAEKSDKAAAALTSRVAAEEAERARGLALMQQYFDQNQVNSSVAIVRRILCGYICAVLFINKSDR